MSESDLERLLAQVEQLIHSQMWESAESAASQLIAASPNSPRAWACWGAVNLNAGRIQPAEVSFRKATTLNPFDSASWHHLSITLHQQRRLGEAEFASRQAVSLHPAEPSFWLQFGNVLFSQERFAHAAEAFERSVAIDPLNPTAWNNLGSAHHVQENWAKAQRAYESSLALFPAQRETRLKLANAAESSQSYSAAERIALQLVADYPECADGWSLLGRTRLFHGRQHEALDALRRAFQLDPTAHAHSRLLQAMQYAEGMNLSTLLAEHRTWDETHAASLLPQTRIAAAGDPSRLRIGFVGSGLGLSAIGHMVLPILRSIDKHRCSITCYFDNRVEDQVTRQFRDAADQWRIIYGLSDEAVVDQINADRIDILFDLMGHFGNRLLVFARKPAPTQVGWFGCIGTTGMPAMDYLLADRFHVLPGEENQYVETVLRMPNDYACYTGPEYAPPISELPALTTGHITFGCFNFPAKWTTGILDAWSEILRRVPTAKLFLKYYALQDSQSQDYFRSQFAARGVEPQRIVLEGSSPHPELLAAYNRVDIALDTQPYSGGVTTCEALWMGVPVITYSGKTFAGRHATSHLTNAGYPQFIANDEEGYVELAVRWANSLQSLTSIRAEMREKVRRSALCNAAGFAADFLNVMTRAHQSSITIK